MNVIKEYNTAKKKKGNVSFGSVHAGRWVFRCSDKESGSLEKILRVPGGVEVATKIATAISKSWLRTAGKKLASPSRLDAACRNAIDKLCKIRTLKDWDGETEWWTNAISEGTKMIYVNRKPVVAAEGISAEDIAAPVNPPHVAEIWGPGVNAAEVLHEGFAQA
jgi:hypothetical protein